MIFNWQASDWVIFFVDIIAILIVIRFLSWKVSHKLEEVEQRQKFERRQRKVNRSNQSLTSEEE
jgi:di/tricarboxylate transporter|tara:strand:+ start:1422 stop:1613 length:192 start_codon:yes stop_codon:yes gene_type:complete